jgi:hypothetical protein
MPVDFIEGKEKYRDMLLEAAETILGYFGFHRTRVLNSFPSNTHRFRPSKNKTARDILV